MTATAPADINEAYADVEKLIYYTIHKFIRANGGDFDDCLSVANEAFVKAYNRFDGSSPFAAWIKTKVWFALLDDLRYRTKIAAKEAQSDGEALLAVIASSGSDFDLEGLLGRLSREARDVVRVVLDPPTEVTKDLALFGDRPVAFRATLRGYLRFMGWRGSEIAEVFTEVREALKEEA